MKETPLVGASLPRIFNTMCLLSLDHYMEHPSLVMLETPKRMSRLLGVLPFQVLVPRGDRQTSWDWMNLTSTSLLLRGTLPFVFLCGTPNAIHARTQALEKWNSEMKIFWNKLCFRTAKFSKTMGYKMS